MEAGSIIAIVVVVLGALLLTSPGRPRRKHGPVAARTTPAEPAQLSPKDYGPSPFSGRAELDPRLLAIPGETLPVFDALRSGVRFGDVAALDHAIEELREVKEYLSDPERFRALGAELPRGILLYGPPGCGKTLLARALAGETGVPYFSISAASFVEQYVGLGAARVRRLFEAAAACAPSIVFIDELDAVGRSRNDTAGGEAEFGHTLNQLLVELDGFAGSPGVLVLAATNRLELLDPALLRPGRFDRRIRIEPPDFEGRRSILELHARDRPFASHVDWADVAGHTVGLAPAALGNIVNEAALLAARRRRSTISSVDVDEACARQLSGTSASHLIEGPTRRLLSVHEAGHALLSQLLRGVPAPTRVTILGRSDPSDSSVWASNEIREVLTKRELIARLVLLLGGRAAELNVLGEPSTYAEDDLAHAAAIARSMVERWAMTGRFDLAGNGRDPRMPRIDGPAAGEEVRRLVAGAETVARTILDDNRPALLRIARALADQESLTAQDVTVLAGASPPISSRSGSPWAPAAMTGPKTDEGEGWVGAAGRR